MKTRLPQGVKKVIGVLSGKGGVGKSMAAVSLAYHLPGRVGILDADVYGPSIPRMLHLKGQPEVTRDNKMIPMENHGLQAMSMGFLSDKAAVWRGLMVMKALQDMIWNTQWRDLDYLVIDFPPGTGDAQLTIMQQVQLAGCVVVSTPQQIALIDALKALEMIQKVHVPLLGTVRNMSGFQCTSCGTHHTLYPNTASTLWDMTDRILDLPFNPLFCDALDQGDLSKAFSNKDLTDRISTFSQSLHNALQ